MVIFFINRIRYFFMLGLSFLFCPDKLEFNNEYVLNKIKKNKIILQCKLFLNNIIIFKDNIMVSLCDINIVISSLEVGKNKYNEIMQYLSTQELEKLSTYYFYADQVRFALGRHITRTQLAKYLSCSPYSIDIQYNNYGKPMIVGYKDIYFNISHSTDFVIVVFDKYPIGIDIEYNLKFDDTLISKVFFTTNEIIYLNSLSSEIKRQEFFKIWTYKEAYIKAIGKGMSADPSSIDIMLNKDLFHYKNDKYRIQALTDIDSNYSCAICYVVNEIDDIRNISYLKD
jgi:4'-phosphopantetheinyl transferase